MTDPNARTPPPAVSPTSTRGYGLHPAAQPAIRRLADEVRVIVEGGDFERVPVRVMEALRPVLSEPGLLAEVHRVGEDVHYLRHVLCADPEGRFTILAIVWKPGQTTTIHGHSAWGAVGVYEGRPNVACYDCDGTADAQPAPVLSSDEQHGPGAVSCVRPGLRDAHRMYNATADDVITIHVYGRDLLRDPESINIVLAP